ncbi:hypothetical protein GGF46_002995 [Coemansia sp. RSA 552]|nr:hypothetical protein GGF46_002995 [Coemansia sp. RSA 552]
MRLFIPVVSAAMAAVATVQAAAIGLADTPLLAVFGNSLSDIGTLKALTLGIVPSSPYWKGRFSSGPTWNEYLELLMGYRLYNKAVGGATSDNDHSTTIDILGIHLPSTQDQINFFKLGHPLFKKRRTRDEDIAILEIGANDYFVDTPRLQEGSLSIANFTQTLADTVVGQLEQLRGIGFRNIVVLNMAAIQDTPMAIQANQRELADATVTTYNNLLAVKANAWAKVASDLSLFTVSDIGGFVKIAAGSSAISSALGLKNVTGACLDTLDTSTQAARMNSAMNATVGSVCTDPSEFFFFDDIHPTERVHRLYGYYLWKALAALKKGKSFHLCESNLLSLIKNYNLGTPVSKPVAI